MKCIFFLESGAELASLKKLFLKVSHYTGNEAYFNWPEDSIDDELLKAQFYVLIDDHILKAFIAYRSGVDTDEITALGTDPDFLKRGYMKTLLNNFAEKYRKNNKSLMLEVHESNLEALGLYHGLGFQIVHKRTGYYKDGKSALVMRLS